MPAALREPISEPSAWIGRELQQQEDSWRIDLDDRALSEIEAAVRHVQEAGLSIPFDREDFPLPTMRRLIDGIPARLEDGVGLLHIRGINREAYTVDECEIIFYGIGTYLGRVLRQSEGELVGHIRSKDDEYGASETDNGYARPGGRRHAGRMDYHADRLPVDVLGMFCVGSAQVGGESILVSAPQVHNILLEERPDLLDVLYEPFNVDWRGGGPPGEDWYPMPMFSYHAGRFTSRVISRQFLTSVVRFGDELGPSDRQAEAVDVLQEIASRPELRLSMDLQPGEIQFLNNHTILHAREAFEDSEGPEHRRHFLRLWITYPPEHRRDVVPLIADQRTRVVDTGGLPTPERYSSSV